MSSNPISENDGSESGNYGSSSDLLGKSADFTSDLTGQRETDDQVYGTDTNVDDGINDAPRNRVLRMKPDAMGYHGAPKV